LASFAWELDCNLFLINIFAAQFGLPASIQSAGRRIISSILIQIKNYGSITQSYFPGGTKKAIVR
jgi:hypothetical protein